MSHTTAQGNAGSLIHRARPGIKHATSRFLLGFISAVPCQEFPPPFFLVFLGPHLWQMEVPRLGFETKLQLPSYTTATAAQNPSHVCNQHHSSQQRQILNPLSKVRDQTHILMDTSRVPYHWVTTGTPNHFLRPHPQHMKAPPGTKSKLQLWPTPQLQQRWILNPPLQGRDQTHAATDNPRSLTHCPTVDSKSHSLYTIN